MGKQSQQSQKQNRKSQTQKSQKSSQNLTQKTLKESFLVSQSQGNQNIDECINKIVRHIVYKAGTNLPIKKLDLQKNVVPGLGNKYEKVMHKVIEVLKEVYGYDLILCDQPASNKQYIVKNLLPYKNLDDSKPDLPENKKQIIRLLVLTHIFMSNNSVGEESLFKFLQTFDIDLFDKNDFFGNVKEFITTDMVRQRYLVSSTDEHTRKNSYSWGTKAEVTVSKQKILQFVCDIYGDCQPKAWKKQYELAIDQEKSDESDAESIDQDESMDVDSD